MFGNMSFRMECRVSGEYRRRGLTGEQARPYGCVRNGYGGKFFRRYGRLSAQHALSVSGEAQCRGGWIGLTFRII